MANPDFVNDSTEQASTGSITLNMPGSWSAGNIIILYVATDGYTPTLSTPNGFQIATDKFGNVASINQGLGVTGMHVFWKRALGSSTATDPAPILAAPSGGGTVQCCHTNSYNNCRTVGNPFHLIATATVGTATTTASPPSITTTINGCTVFSCASSEVDDSTFNSWNSTGAASPSGSIDNGFDTSLGNACSWAGGRGGFATAGGPHNCFSTFGTSTRQAQVTFALASLNESIATGAESVTTGNSTVASAGTVVAGGFTGNSAVTSDLSTVAATATVLATGTEAATSGASTLSATATVLATGTATVTGGGSTITAIASHAAGTGIATVTSGNSTTSMAGTVLATGTATVTGAGTTPAASGTVLATGSAAVTGGGSSVSALNARNLSLGPVTIRQKANGTSSPASPLTTRAVLPAWTATTSYTLNLGVRVVNGGNAYELQKSGISGVTGPTGTGAAISDGTAAWNYVGSDNAAMNTVTGSMFLASVALGDNTALAAPTDNFSNTWALVDNQNYAPPFSNSCNTLYSAIGGTGGTGHTVSFAYNSTDEATDILVAVPGGTLIQQVAYVEHTSSTGNVVTGPSVSITGPAIILAFGWLDGVVRTPGTSHKAVFGGGFSIVPDATALVVLDSNGYIQHALGVLDATASGMYPATYTPTITTDQSEGAAIRVVAIQAAPGSVGNESVTSGASTVAASGTVVTNRTGNGLALAGPSTVSETGTVTVTGNESATGGTSAVGATAGALATGSGAVTGGSSSTNAAGNVVPPSTGTGDSEGTPSTVAGAGATLTTGNESTTSGASALSAAGSAPATGTEAITSALSAVASSATVLATGTGAITGGGTSVSAVAVSGVTKIGDASITTGSTTVASAANVLATASGAVTSASSAVASAATVLATASGAVTSAGSATAGSATVLATGTGAALGGPSLTSATGTVVSVTHNGSAAVTSASSTVAAAGSIAVTGNAAVTSGGTTSFGGNVQGTTGRARVTSGSSVVASGKALGVVVLDRHDNNARVIVSREDS